MNIWASQMAGAQSEQSDCQGHLALNLHLAESTHGHPASVPRQVNSSHPGSTSTALGVQTALVSVLPILRHGGIRNGAVKVTVCRRQSIPPKETGTVPMGKVKAFDAPWTTRNVRVSDQGPKRACLDPSQLPDAQRSKEEVPSCSVHTGWSISRNGKQVVPNKDILTLQHPLRLILSEDSENTTQGMAGSVACEQPGWGECRYGCRLRPVFHRWKPVGFTERMASATSRSAPKEPRSVHSSPFPKGKTLQRSRVRVRQHRHIGVHGAHEAPLLVPSHNAMGIPCQRERHPVSSGGPMHVPPSHASGSTGQALEAPTRHGSTKTRTKPLSRNAFLAPRWPSRRLSDRKGPTGHCQQ
jgi:hypothetical protein